MGQARTLRHVTIWMLVFCCLWVLAACGGGSSSGPVVADAANVETDTTLKAGEWEVTLFRPTEKIKVVGKGDITYQAEGDFLVVFVKVTNRGQAMQVVGRDLFTVHDGQGQEYKPVKSAVQTAYVLEFGMELSLDSPLDAGKTRDSIVIFDVPTSATDLTLGLKGTEETLALGF